MPILTVLDKQGNKGAVILEFENEVTAELTFSGGVSAECVVSNLIKFQTWWRGQENVTKEITKEITGGFGITGESDTILDWINKAKEWKERNE